MIRTLTATAVSALVLALLAMPAAATDLNSQLSDQQISDFCATAGLGEHKASLTIDGVATVGTVECESEDVSGTAGSDDSVDTPDASDDSVDAPESEDETADDNGTDSSDDEGDDNSGGSSGSDDGDDSSDD
jgi:hypothetical protein